VLFDGRDVPDFSAQRYLERLDVLLDTARSCGCEAAIASGGGRMTTTMDRYGANWQLVEAGWHAHVLGDARPVPSAAEALARSRREQPGISDQDIPPFTIVDDDGRPVGTIEDGDAVLLFNFRGDRAIELAETFTASRAFDHFDRVRTPMIAFASLVQYDVERGFPEHFLLSPPRVPDTLSELLAGAGVRQFACAETQKFGHVTYFWNGNRAQRFDPDLESYLEIPSERVAFQHRPAMRSRETAAAIIEAIDAGETDFIRTNFAGGDMVGHTGDLAATRRAIEAIDAAIDAIAAAVESARGCLVVTADHGNAEDMVEREADGRPLRDVAGAPVGKTSHSVNPVSFVVREFGGRVMRLRDDLPGAGLANVAATLAELLGFVAPAEYEPSLLTW
jgi:2,3-bisphosphoglycerate-independent phosphoglycerate mutase